jgi:hypothetical protein
LDTDEKGGEKEAMAMPVIKNKQKIKNILALLI